MDVQATTAPQKPDSGSSATDVGGGGDFGGDAWARLGRGEHVARYAANPAVGSGRSDRTRRSGASGVRSGRGPVVGTASHVTAVRSTGAGYYRHFGRSSGCCGPIVHSRVTGPSVTYGCPHVPIGTLRAATTLALWAAAWQGGASADDVLGAIDDSGHRAGVRAATGEIADATGLPGPGWPSAGSAALLPLLRGGRRGGVAAALPGDMRGLPIGGDLTVAALDAGAVVVLPASTSRWYPATASGGPTAATPSIRRSSLAEAHELLDAAVGRATRSLTALDVARGSSTPGSRSGR